MAVDDASDGMRITTGTTQCAGYHSLPPPALSISIYIDGAKELYCEATAMMDSCIHIYGNINIDII